MGNTGRTFEQYIFEKVSEKCKQDNNIIAYLHKRYYSLDRQDYIIPDVTIEKIIDGQVFFVIVIECKDYDGYISVSEIEEFHSKLQQIGADNTKGVMVTRNGKFQKSARKYAKSKGISLAVYNDKKNRIFLGVEIPLSLTIYIRKKSLFFKIIETLLDIIKGICIFFKFYITAFIEYCIQIYMRKYDFERIIKKFLRY